MSRKTADSAVPITELCRSYLFIVSGYYQRPVTSAELLCNCTIHCICKMFSDRKDSNQLA